LIEEKAALMNELKTLSRAFSVEKERNENVEKVSATNQNVESKVSKKQDSYINDLRMTIRSLEEELRQSRGDFAEKLAEMNKKVEYYKNRFNSANSKLY
jgi:transcriptional regulator with AAA-type ATPase domain